MSESDKDPRDRALARRIPLAASKGDAAREARIKAALKANLARRKDQARAREAGQEDQDG